MTVLLPPSEEEDEEVMDRLRVLERVETIACLVDSSIVGRAKQQVEESAACATDRTAKLEGTSMIKAQKDTAGPRLERLTKPATCMAAYSMHIDLWCIFQKRSEGGRHARPSHRYSDP